MYTMQLIYIYIIRSLIMYILKIQQSNSLKSSGIFNSSLSHHTKKNYLSISYIYIYIYQYVKLNRIVIYTIWYIDIDVVWINRTNPNRWKTNKRGCTVDEVLQVVQGSLSVTLSQEQLDSVGENTISGYSYKQFLDIFQLVYTVLITIFPIRILS